MSTVQLLNFKSFSKIITLNLIIFISYLRNVSPATPNQIELIEKQISQLKPDTFSEDKILIQDVNPDSSQTLLYYYESLGKKIPIFRQEGLQSKGKLVVVLQQGEDRLPTCRNKNTFVVLKQTTENPNLYHVVLAYIKETQGGQTIEWDIWDDRGISRTLNKANLFGWTKCSFSSLVPCKSELQTVLPRNLIFPASITGLPNSSIPSPDNPSEVLDALCDLQHTKRDGAFIGSTVDAMINSMAILSGARLVYQNEENLGSEVAKDIKGIIPSSQISAMGRSFFGNEKTPEALDIASELGAEKFIQKGREGIAKAVMMFDALTSRLGALAKDIPFESVLDSTKGQDVEMWVVNKLGKALLRGFFEGASTADKEEKFMNPNPKALLKEDVVEELVSLKKISEDRFRGRLMVSLLGYNLLSIGGSPPPPPPPSSAPAPDLSKGVPINITVGSQKVQVTAVPGGMFVKNQLVKGKFTKGVDNDITFVPQAKPNKNSSYPPSAKSAQVNVDLDGQIVSAMVIEGGILVNGEFKPGDVTDSGDPNVFEFAPDLSDEVREIGFAPDGRQGFITIITYEGKEVEAIELDDGVVIDGKFIKGKFKKGKSGTKAQYIPPPPDSSPQPSLPPPPPNSSPQPSLPPPPSSSPSPSPSPSSPSSGNSSEPPIAYFFYMDNSTTSQPFVVYVTKKGFLFYGVFFPGRTIDLEYIEINTQVFRAVPIDRKRIQKGLMFPPMPTIYTFIYRSETKVIYFVITGFLVDGHFIPGKVVPGGIELNGKFVNASEIPPEKSPVMPGMAGAYVITIQGQIYLAFVVNQGVIIGGVFFPATFRETGIEIQSTLYPGTYTTYIDLKPHTQYNVIEYYKVYQTILTILVSIEGHVEFGAMYNFDTAFGVEGKLSLGVSANVPPPAISECPPGEEIVVPLGLTAEAANKLMTRDLVSELLMWGSHMKTGEVTGSKALDNLGNIVVNSFDWYGDKSAGETFQENLISGLWTPFGLADDIVDTIGFFTGAGKVSDDYGYIDDLFGVVLTGANVVGGVAGKIIDGVGSVLNPVGLGGIWKTVSGITSGALGIAGAAEATKVYGVYDLIKVGAKTVHLGFLLGLRGSESEKKKQELAGQIQHLESVKAYLLAHPPKCEAVPGSSPSPVPVPPPSTEYSDPSAPPASTPSGGFGFSLNANINAGVQAEAGLGFSINAGSASSLPPPPPATPQTSAAAERAAAYAAQVAAYQESSRTKRDGQTNQNGTTSTSNPVLITDSDLFSHIGWKTMKTNQETLSNALEDQIEPFIGIGACEYNPPTEKELESASNTKQLVDLFMRAMRTQCIANQRDALAELTKFKRLSMTPEKSLSVDTELLSNLKLTPEEYGSLSKSFEMTIFSETYYELLKSKLPTHNNNSFLRKFVANYIAQSLLQGSNHSIKLLRNLIKTLQTFLTKSLQDFYRYKFCPKCKEDLVKNAKNDPIEILGLIEFLSTTELGSNSVEIQKDYEKWFVSKKDSLQKTLQMYLA